MTYICKGPEPFELFIKEGHIRIIPAKFGQNLNSSLGDVI